MDVFLDMTGTITDMESENFAMYKLAEAIKNKFSMKMPTEEVLRRIENYGRPYMEKRDIEYIPIRFLIVEGVREIMGKLNREDEEWLFNEYVETHARYVKLKDTSLGGLRGIRGVAEHLGLITDADTPYTRKLLKSLGIEDFFDSITTAEEIGVGKPNPKIFLEAAKKGKSKKKAYIGDSERRDMMGAKKAGMIAIKIGRESKHADFIAEDLIEAWHILEEI